jgi:hypothetical protein
MVLRALPCIGAHATSPFVSEKNMIFPGFFAYFAIVSRHSAANRGPRRVEHNAPIMTCVTRESLQERPKIA